MTLCLNHWRPSLTPVTRRFCPRHKGVVAGMEAPPNKPPTDAAWAGCNAGGAGRAGGTAARAFHDGDRISGVARGLGLKACHVRVSQHNAHIACRTLLPGTHRGWPVYNQQSIECCSTWRTRGRCACSCRRTTTFRMGFDRILHSSEQLGGRLQR